MQVGYLCAGLLSIELKLNWRAAIVLQILGLLALCGAFLYVPAEALDASHKNSPSASAAVLAEEASSSSSEAGEATPHSGGGEGEAAGQGSFVERRKERPSLETERHLWREEPPSSPPRALQPAQARRRSWGRAFLVLFRQVKFSARRKRLRRCLSSGGREEKASFLWLLCMAVCLERRFTFCRR